MEPNLRHAIEGGHIWPALQPIVDIKSGALKGFEILARWDDPVLGEVKPLTFVPMFDEIGLINALSQSLLRRTCEAASAWNGAFTLAINVSPSQITIGTTADWIRNISAETNFPIDRIEVEVTENSLLTDNATTQDALRELVDAGISVSLDDYGTGYSNLSRLEAFPFRQIKIDAQFVSGLEQDARKRRIVSAVIGLSHSLGIPVVAEGVETETEHEVLREFGCEFAQGWLYGKATSLDAAAHLVSASPLSAPSPEHFPAMSPFEHFHQIKTLYRSAPVGLCFVNTEFRHVTANDAFAAIHGLDRSAIEGKTIYEIMDRETAEHAEDLLRGTTDKAQPPQIYSLRGKDIKVFAEKVVDATGEVIGFSLLSIDVTEMNRLFCQLMQSQEALSLGARPLP